ncbi:MAG: response regulator, partial [Thermoguttaceae bacterium]|nr:response regulator [Thermoguttaceae bacterium]
LILGSALSAVLIYHRRAGRAAALLAKNSKMWKLLLDSLPIHVFAKDASHGFQYIFNNKERTNFFGIPKEKLLGMDDYDLLPKELADTRRNADIALTQTNAGTDEVFLRALGADGDLHDLYSILVAFTDSDGTKLVLGCSIDQTELQRANAKAKENAEWFQKTLISIGDGVLTTDTAGNITLLNPIAEKMLGVTLEECKGKCHTDYFNIVSYLDDKPVSSPVEHCLKSDEIVSLANHTDLISRDGTRYYIADSAAPIRDAHDKIIGAILVFRDVTHEYNLRDQLQASATQLKDALAMAQHASQAKGIFLSQMSHEIRTPLNAMIGYLNIAQDSFSNSDKVRECLSKGLDASSHLLSIINDILDISSIESGKLKISNEDFDFKRLLTGIVNMFYNQAQSKKIKFEMQLRDLTEEWLVGDSLRVNQILLNLLSNAMKFTPAGGSITLMVKQLAIVRNRVQLMLQVSDTGCGMSAEYKSRLFKPFEQQDASTARKFGGTGLGLSITKNLVSLMGGTIDVDSQENKGTTFTIHLPFAKSTTSKTMPEADFSKLRALVVDDQDEDRAYIQMVLTKCGVKSDAVASGESAIHQLELRLGSRHPYDLCLLDLRLEGIDGIETARRIRQLSGATKNMPIILVTAYDIAAVAPDAHDAGVNKIIQKPLFQSTFFDFLMSSYYDLNEQQNTVKTQEALKGLHIMLVEDNQMNMDISTQYLERAGMIITQAWNGQEAVETFTASAPGTFQVILMDIQMPIMDGYQATEKIRSSSHPEAKTIPIIAMTANAFNEDVVKAMSAGMNDHIAKPVFYDRLFTVISKLTGQAQAKSKQ